MEGIYGDFQNIAGYNYVRLKNYSIDCRNALCRVKLDTRSQSLYHLPQFA